MRRVFITVGLACALALPASAGAQTGQDGQTTPPPSGRTTKTPPAKPGNATHKTATAGQKSAATAQQATGGNLNAADRHFVTAAAIGGMAEVELGRMAAEKATNPDVKQFGQRMVDDHSKANDELKSWASSNSVTLPTELDAKNRSVQERLSKLSGAAFDRAYMTDMVQDHAKDVAEFQQASKTLTNADLKAWAAKTLPTLQDHKKMAQEVHAKVGGGTTAHKTSNHKSKSPKL